MEYIAIEGGRRLSGRVCVNGSKNAALPILAATLLTGEESKLEGIPPLLDVFTMFDVLRQLGAEVKEEGKIVRIWRSDPTRFEASHDLVRRMRASFLVMGPLLTRHGRARISLPGGCAIGSRPIDLHLKGLVAMGAVISVEHGYVEAKAARLRGAEIHLDVPSVGATENLMMAATLAEGTTYIYNAAREPEVVDLAGFLNAMGAVVRGAGTDVIRISGVRELKGASYRVIPDRIEAGTYLLAGAITGGEVVVENAVAHHLEAFLAKLREAGVTVEVSGEAIRAAASGRPRAVDITTLPYPGFPTDLQPPFMAFLALSEGTSLVTENIFEDRFRHVDELKRMGAKIRLQGKVAMVEGVDHLTGAPVTATDLRAGAALVLAGLAARGITEVGAVHHLDRGYVRLEETLASLGAQIERRREPADAKVLQLESVP